MLHVFGSYIHDVEVIRLLATTYRKIIARMKGLVATTHKDAAKFYLLTFVLKVKRGIVMGDGAPFFFVIARVCEDNDLL